MYPGTQVVEPVHILPPHCPHCGARTTPVELVGVQFGSVSVPVGDAVIVIVFFVGKQNPGRVYLVVTNTVPVASGHSVTVVGVPGRHVAGVVTQVVLVVGQRVYGAVVVGRGEQS